MCHLSLHRVHMLNDEKVLTSSLNHFPAISFPFWEMPFPFSASLDFLQRSIKILSSASDHSVLFLFLAIHEELSLDSEDASESGCEGYMLKVEHGKNCQG